MKREKRKVKKKRGRGGKIQTILEIDNFRIRKKK